MPDAQLRLGNALGALRSWTSAAPTNAKLPKDLRDECLAAMRDVIKELLVEEAEPPKPRKYRIEGQVYLADGFEWPIVAESRAGAEQHARFLAENQPWPNASVQEVCINSVTEITDEHV